jgi:hypothetical protein
MEKTINRLLGLFFIISIVEIILTEYLIDNFFVFEHGSMYIGPYALFDIFLYIMFGLEIFKMLTCYTLLILYSRRAKKADETIKTTA